MKGSLRINMEELRKTHFPKEAHLKIPSLPPKFLECKLINAPDDLQKDKVDEDKGNKLLQNGMPFPFSADSTLRFATVEAAKTMTKGNAVKRIIDITLNINESGVTCLPGDTIGIVPQNVPQEVDELLRCLGLFEQADNLYRISVSSETKKKNAAIPPYLPEYFTLRDLLQTCVDIRTIPKKALLRVLCEYTSDEFERRRLEELCSQEGSEAYSNLIINKGVTILNILKIFSSCVPPVERLLEHLPRLQARPYSIALRNGCKIHIAVTVVDNTHQDMTGLCSSWLNNITSDLRGDGELYYKMQKMTLNSKKLVQIPVYLRSSTPFRVPEDPSVSLIMVGPGTGVAPFLGFLQYRSEQKKASISKKFGYSWLFFGCRYEDKDFLYRTEIEEYLSQGVLNKLSVSFSRDINKLKPDIKYVQDNIKKEKEEFVSQFLESNNVTFICGDVKNMAKDVRETIVQCIQEVKGVTEIEAKEMVHKLEKEKKYLQDVWR